MSTTVSKTLTINMDNRDTYLSLSAGLGTGTYDEMLATNALLLGTATLTDSAKDILFPNSTVNPTKANVTIGYKSNGKDNYIKWRVNGTTVFETSGKDTTSGGVARSSGDISNTTITNSTKDTSIDVFLLTTSHLYYARCTYLIFNYYFKQYSFTATAGTSVTSASVSSSTGFDGDTITYSCVLQDGATFDGWYSGTTKVSSSKTYTHTVNGADKALTAKATAVTTKTVSMRYNGQTVNLFTTQSGTAITYGSTVTQISSGSKTLKCNGKVMGNNVVIGNKTLQCNGKLMASDVVVTVS